MINNLSFVYFLDKTRLIVFANEFISIVELAIIIFITANILLFIGIN